MTATRPSIYNLQSTTYNGTPQFRVLGDAQVERLYQAVLECLERTGVNVLNAEGCQLLKDAGARVDGVRVRIPARIIQDAVAACPPTFSVWGRDGQHCMEMLPERVYFGPGVTSGYAIDLESGERRPACRQDLIQGARVSDALENIDYLMGMFLPGDVPAHRSAVFEFADMLAHSGKPLMAWADSLDNVQDIYRMAAAVAGSEAALRQRPLYAFFAAGLGPLVVPGSVMGNVLWNVERGIPVVYHGPGVSGVSAPVTGAGTLVICLAGSLAGLTIVQLKQPGAPIAIGAVTAPMDPRTGRPSYGAPEMSLYSAAMSEVAHYLNLPFMGTAGASESKTLDLQAAIESSVQVVYSLLSRTTMPHDAGFLDCADISSLEMLVMTDEIIGMVRRMQRGIEVSDETLMLDLIDAVGPGGEFLSKRETASRFRQEIWQPRLMDRQPWSRWAEKGAVTMRDRIRQRVQAILASHIPPPLPDGAAEIIQAILQKSTI